MGTRGQWSKEDVRHVELSLSAEAQSTHGHVSNNKYYCFSTKFGVVWYAVISNPCRHWCLNKILKYMVLALGLEDRQRLKKIARKQL